ncbi:hypothetical protein [Clostridium sp. C2-6-12]|uniref:hypothetical protein n=1 Tax=Clostridium sp. C2-6-12 TaxID=2698832 RepID=UPI001370ACA9|nr:hypothetical protein [Clostridium sp. C2-6-12]
MALNKLFNLKNIYNSRISNLVLIIIIIIMIVILGNCFTGCGTKNTKEIKTAKEVSNKDMNDVIKAIKESQIACFTEIIYASKNEVIFYGPNGLIVYNIGNKQIYRAIDLKSINMNYVQGDTVTIFNVNKDESKILMYNNYGDDKNIYLYDIEKDTLEKTDNKKFTPNDNASKYCELEKFDDDYMIAGSNCVQIDDSNICFLIYPKELDGNKGTSGMQIVILNKDTNKAERYNVFS